MSQFLSVVPANLHMVDIKEVSKGAALRLQLLDCQAAFLGKPHERMTFFFLMSITSESVVLLQKRYIILSTVCNDFPAFDGHLD